MKCKNCNGQKLVWCSRCQGSGIEKQWFLIMLICLIAIAVFSCNPATAQTAPILTLDASTEVTAETDNYGFGIAFGLENFKQDYATIGMIHKRYQDKGFTGFRLMGSVSINEILSIYTASDIFIYKTKFVRQPGDNTIYTNSPVTPRIELGAGLGLRVNSLRFLIGIQSDDYDPVKDKVKQPTVQSKLMYFFQLKK